jgi:hypothetical protein
MFNPSSHQIRNNLEKIKIHRFIDSKDLFANRCSGDYDRQGFNSKHKLPIPLQTHASLDKTA